VVADQPGGGQGTTYASGHLAAGEVMQAISLRRSGASERDRCSRRVTSSFAAAALDIARWP